MAAHVIQAARICTMACDLGNYDVIHDSAIAVHEGMIAWVGAQADLPEKFQALPVRDMGDRLLTPALIDCHTHLVFGGNRVNEFDMRQNGVSYEEIARTGGGIVSTVKATREASLDELIAAALPRVDALLGSGVGLIEIKSGYGLDLDTEIKMLRAARELAERRPVHVVTTYLGAHAVPPEYEGRADAYIDYVCEHVLPEIARLGLADAVDGFCENIGFSAAQIERVFQAASELYLPIKLHAEQLSDQGGAQLAAKYGALSVDHLEYLSDEGVDAIAQSGSVAVLLPGAFFTLKETQRPPIQRLREKGVPMAVATDANPGSSPLYSLLAALNMSCILFGLTPFEALAGATCNAAKALGLDDHLGSIEVGKRARIASWRVHSPAELVSSIGLRPLDQMAGM